MSKQTRATFGGKLSAILVAAGSTIGLGNIWRFPYLAGENGGAAFMLIYLFCLFIIAIPVMLCEFAIGRRTQKNAVGAFGALSKKWKFLGYNGIISSILVAGYYYIIAGWSLFYLVKSIDGSLFAPDIDYTLLYNDFVASPWPILYTVIFILLTHFIVSRGVTKGIEKASNIMMPALFIILIIMAIYVAFMPNVAEGYRFFLTPNFKEAFTPETFFTAAGQAFFSLSICMGIMVTYSSYFKKDTNLISTSLNVSLLTLLVALLAGLVIFPAVFSAGLQPTEGPGLIFITLPEIFKGTPLPILGSTIFFILIAMAALTSTISTHEVFTAFISEEYKISRKVAPFITTAMSITLSMLTLLWSFDINIFGQNFTSTFGIFDFTLANIVLPIGGFLTCIFIGWYMKPDFLKGELTNNGTLPSTLVPAVLFLIRYISPLLIFYIFLQSIAII